MFSEKLWKAKVRDILENYQKRVVSAIKSGSNGMEENKWTFAGAFLYSLTVITTIGESFYFPYCRCIYFSNFLFKPLNLFVKKKIQSSISDSFKASFFPFIKPNELYSLADTSAFIFENKTRKCQSEELLKNVDNLLAAGYLAVRNRARLFALLMPRLMPTFLVATDKSP